MAVAKKTEAVKEVVVPEPVEPAAEGADKGDPKAEEPSDVAEVTERVEFYDATRRGGEVVRVKHNLETGHTEIID